MDEQRVRIHDDLRGLIEGEVLVQPMDRVAYRSDAGRWEADPLAVVHPHTEADLVALVHYAREQRIPLHPRGAGTFAGGGAVGEGLVVDFSRHFRRILEVRPSSVVVQAGVVLERLNAELAPLGRRIGPDPPGAEVHTVGGLLGRNACGPRYLRYGAMANHVESVRAVFASGDVETVCRVARVHEDAEPRGVLDTLASRLHRLAAWNEERFSRPAGAWSGGNPGYSLHEAFAASSIDLARLITGSEGTLALVSEATLRTVAVPRAACALVLPFGRLADAAEAVSRCLEARPSACELFDWRSLSLARDADPALRARISEKAEAALVVEFEGDSAEEVGGRARRVGDLLYRQKKLAAEPVEVPGRSEAERLVGLRRTVLKVQLRGRGPSRPVEVVDDLRVPPQALPAFLERIQGLMQQRALNWTIDAEGGIARVHVRAYLDLSSPRDQEHYRALAEEVSDLAFSLEGTVSAGPLADPPAARRRMRGDLFNVHREIKYSFDPDDLLNPGKMVGEEGGAGARMVRMDFDADAGEGSVLASGPESATVRWVGRDRWEQINACVHCGICRSEKPAMRVCPAFRSSHLENASPRAQVGMLQQFVSGTLDPKLWGSEDLKAQADQCVHCNMCVEECPSAIDVSALMVEAKAAYVASRGLTPDDWMLSRIDIWSAWANRLPLLFNGLMASQPARWMLERMFGLSRHRKLPRAGRFSFLRKAEWMGLTKPRPHLPGPRVAYFLDIFANHFDHELADCVVALLRHAGVNVYVPKAQKGCGMPALVAGDLDRARDLMRANLKVLGNAVRDGYSVVCSEPTAALMLRREAQRISDDLDAALVAENTFEVGQYLSGLVARGDLGAPEVPVAARLGYHQPCHLRALVGGTPGLDLVRAIPQLEVEFIDRGCSGMAGTYGLAARHLRPSLRAGRGLLRRLRDPDLQLGSTECSACRLQMEQFSGKPTVHPLKLLALGYGVNPSIRRSLGRPEWMSGR